MRPTEKTAPSFRFPAEWEPHAATWLTWPHNRETWPENLPAAQAEFETFTRTLAEVEPVHIVATGNLASQLEKKFSQCERVRVFEISTNDSWIRDYGPTFVKSVIDHRPAGIDWNYDGWGKKYPPYDDDQRAAKKILSAINIPRIHSNLIMEGGSIDSNGQSIAMTTRNCQLRRNPHLTEFQIREELEIRLGLDQILMLDSVEITGDDTDGHIDQVARFVSDKQVVVSQQQWNTTQPAFLGANLETIVIPDPNPICNLKGQLPASYTNFYIANEIVIVPAFGTSQDEFAAAHLSEVFAGRQVISLPCENLIVGLGAFHCLSQQQPA